MILAIDPGLHGACALYDPASNKVTTYDMPTHCIMVNHATRHQLDLTALAQWIDNAALLCTTAILEDPNALPKQGITSAFSFGRVCGILQMALVMAEIPYTLVKPATWKRHMGVTSDKDECRRRASQLFPSAASQWARKQDDGRAEAALLAYYHHQTGGVR